MAQERNTLFLKVEGLRKSFGKLRVLEGLSFSLSVGQILGVIGPSGSGKTTLLRCLDMLEPLDEGCIEFAKFGAVVGAGGSVEEIPTLVGNRPEILRQRIGFVFQAFNLWSDRSVLQNLTLAPRVVLGMSRLDASSRALQLLERFDLGDKLNSKTWELSGGQRQRVAIVRALMMDPEILLCDEVTSALDPVLAYGVLQMIRALSEEGLTMIVVTHHIEFASSLCDRIAYLDRGQFLQIGTPREVAFEPVSAEIREFLKVLRAAA